MSDIAIKIENLGKRYKYGAVARVNNTLRADLADWARGVFTRRGSSVQSRESASSLIPPNSSLPSPVTPSTLHPQHSTFREVHEKHIAEDPNYFWALRDINLEVKQGEVVGIIGRNGAGKSTLLKILSRITPPTTGSITYNGRMSSLLEVGAGFHRELTGRENIFLNGSILGMKRTEITKKFDEIVAFAEVEKFIDTPVKFYSSGMYVRLAFAVAAHLEPEILIVDEVLAVGDASFQKKCLGKMSDVAKQGRTILFVSHNMSAIAGLCQSAILLENGRAILMGSVRDIVNKYTSTVTSASTVDLTSLPHGGQRQYAELTRLSVFNGIRTPCNTFPMGESIIIQLELRCARMMTNAEVGVKISSLAGIAIHYLTSSWEGFHCDLQEGVHCLEVVVPRIMLLPGKYLLNAWILRVGNWSDDLVQDIATIEIIGSNVNGHAPAFDKYAYSGCEVYAPSQWKIVTNPDSKG